MQIFRSRVHGLRCTSWFGVLVHVFNRDLYNEQPYIFYRVTCAYGWVRFARTPLETETYTSPVEERRGVKRCAYLNLFMNHYCVYVSSCARVYGALIAWTILSLNFNE